MSEQGAECAKLQPQVDTQQTHMQSFVTHYNEYMGRVD